MKHYGNYLPEVGNPIKYLSRDIETLQDSISTLKKSLERKEIELKYLEQDFYNEIKKNWSEEEIKEAKEKANKINELQRN